MKKISLLIIAILSVVACSKEETNLVINGKVQDLKKGTLFLQQIKDTSLVTLDSVVIDGDPVFTFETYIEDPQVMYLYLEKVDNSQFDDRLLFFAEPGEMTVNTTLDNFETDIVVEGSENHIKLLEYQKMVERFNSQNLDLIREHLEAQQEQNEEKMEATNKKLESLLRRRYLFTVNYALNNKEHAVAPYLAVSEIYDANIKYLDTIYNSLNTDIRKSTYGKALEDFLNERRAAEEKASTEAQEDTTA